MKKILVPVTFSKTSKNALRHAYSIAKQYGATLSLLHCYPEQEYNREYDFGKEAYDKGLKKMLVDFYNECIQEGIDHKYNIITYTGSVSDIVARISVHYDLFVMSKKVGFEAKPIKYFYDTVFYISTKSRCPTLIVSAIQEDFSFQEAGNIWHIKRSEMERSLIHDELDKLGIDSSMVSTKSLMQEKFVSAFWKNIVAYTKTHDKELLKAISLSYKEEQIGLLILVNRLKGMFEVFLKDDAFKIISQFDIPILIFQVKNKVD
jgi:hypothetical protein